MLEQAIAEFYEVQESGIVTVHVDGDQYTISSGVIFTKEEIEWAAITTVFDVEYA